MPSEIIFLGIVLAAVTCLMFLAFDWISGTTRSQRREAKRIAQLRETVERWKREHSA